MRRTLSIVIARVGIAYCRALVVGPGVVSVPLAKSYTLDLNNREYFL